MLTLVLDPVGAVPGGRCAECARAFLHRGVYVPGCPPHGTAITDGACEALGIDVGVARKARAAIEALHDF